MHWASNPLVQQYINLRITGDPDLLWIDSLPRNHVQQTLERGLCIACGAGSAELHAISIDLCKEMDAVDLSPKSIEIAMKRSKELGFENRIHYRVDDLNKAVFPEDTYDLVFTASGMHHIQELEHLIAQLKKSLKPDGLLAVSEYVGPNRVQYTEIQLDYANRLLDSLPDEVKTGKPVVRIDEEILIRIDPSEAVRSADIVSLIRADFEVIEERFFGGTILGPLFDSGAIKPELLMPPDKDDPPDPSHLSHALEPIMREEWELNKLGILPDDHVIILARQK